jgi:hydroxymethylbilane synthase
MPVGSQATQGSRPLRLGTRGSPLALAQSRWVQGLLLKAWPELGPAGVEITVIKTTGDRIQDRPLSEVGNKGLFTKELEEALLARTIDFAVHSMKDVPTVLPDGLGIACVLLREDPRDALISVKAKRLADLPNGASVGTASLRRGAQLLHRRPDLKVQNLRGNVDTRIKKVTSGALDATFLALAGLRRLGLAHHASAIMEPDEMLPAVAQGAVCIECRAGDDTVRQYLAPLEHRASVICVTAERALLAALDGSCRTPIAALAELDAVDRLTLRAAIVRPDGSEMHETRRQGAAGDARAMGDDAGAELKRRGGAGFFTDV